MTDSSGRIGREESYSRPCWLLMRPYLAILPQLYTQLLLSSPLVSAATCSMVKTVRPLNLIRILAPKGNARYRLSRLPRCTILIHAVGFHLMSNGRKRCESWYTNGTFYLPRHSRGLASASGITM